jgi:uncharacterized protein YjbJ (UPF0337 family)
VGEPTDLGMNRCPLTTGIAAVAPYCRGKPDRVDNDPRGCNGARDRSRGRGRNKARNKSQKLRGQVKEAAGRATDTPRLEAEGRADQTPANLKQPPRRSRTPSAPAADPRLTS